MAELKRKGMYDDTLILYSADNGGVGDGNNYPLRGEKHTNWQGGMRTASFLSGGFLPRHVRGTRSNMTISITDWYPTFAALAGAQPSDDPLVPPLPIDPKDPGKDIYQGNKSFPPLDGVNIWPMLTGLSSVEPHRTLWLSREAQAPCCA